MIRRPALIPTQPGETQLATLRWVLRALRDVWA
jgi:hypothetical protein